MRVVCLAVSFASISCDAYYISTERTSIDVSSDRSPFNLYSTKGPQKKFIFCSDQKGLLLQQIGDI